MTPWRMIVLAVMAAFVLPVGSGWAIGNDKATFVSGCLKAKGARPGECECMYDETQGKLASEQAAFLIASMGGDTAEIQQAAGKLSFEQRQEAFSSWVEVVNRCLSR